MTILYVNSYVCRSFGDNCVVMHYTKKGGKFVYLLCYAQALLLVMVV